MSKQFKLFIVSSSTNSIITKYLKRHGILNCFQEMLGWDVEKSKVKKLKTILGKNNYLPENAIFLTDTAGDILEAKEAKINFTVGILGGYQGEKALQAENPFEIVENMNDFFDLIQDKFVK